ncbi:hypothetical protein BJV82DRAFT_581427 [Fennellomyces sp. T-0311]|nr:hypothetical protein BJV82DRAFT_581427 [Fennellomyces sp. T-0311]
MPLPKLFKNKGKLREQSAVSSRHPMDAILSREFTHLNSRAQSPTDLLDMVGYPRIQNASSPNLSTPAAAPSSSFRRKQRPSVGPRRASFHSFSPTTRPKPLRIESNTSSPPPLEMPTPLLAVPPTEDMLRSDTWADKTLDEEEEAAGDPRALSRAPQELPPPPQPQEQHHRNEIDELYHKLWMYQQEYQVWVKRESEHRLREEWMYKQLQETRAQLKRLQLVAYHNRPIIDEAFCGDETSDVDEKDRQRTNQGRRQYRVPETYYKDDRSYYSEEEDDESSGYVSEEEEEEAEEEEEQARRRYVRRHPAYYFYPPPQGARPWSAVYHHPMDNRIPYYYYGYHRRPPLRRQRSRKSSDTSVRSVPVLRHGNPRNVEFSTGEAPPYGWNSAPRRSTAYL